VRDKLADLHRDEENRDYKKADRRTGAPVS
jgi:hypothetical protein